MPPLSYRQHEVSFCSDVSKWSDKIFAAHPELPFGSSEIEAYGKGSLKRQDFRVYERKERASSRATSRVYADSSTWNLPLRFRDVSLRRNVH